MKFKMWLWNIANTSGLYRFKVLGCILGLHDKDHFYEFISEKGIEVRCCNCDALVEIIENSTYCDQCQGKGGESSFCVEDGEYYWEPCEKCNGTGEKQ